MIASIRLHAATILGANDLISICGWVVLSATATAKLVLLLRGASPPSGTGTATTAAPTTTAKIRIVTLFHIYDYIGWP